MTPAETLRCAAVGITHASVTLTSILGQIERSKRGRLRPEDIEALKSTLADLARAEEDVRGVARGLEDEPDAFHTLSPAERAERELATIAMPRGGIFGSSVGAPEKDGGM